MNRYTSVFIAAVLPMLFFRWFAPTPAGQIDFWLLWLLAMLLLALPMIFAEVALAHRSGQPPLKGMQALTREADVTTLWRGFSGFSVLVGLVMAALLVSGAQTRSLEALSALNVEAGVPAFALSAGLMVVAFILSFLGRALLPVGLALVVAGWIFGLMGGIQGIDFVMTSVSLAEWGRAVALALVSVGAGTGLYWFGQSHVVNGQLANQEINYEAPPVARQVLPIWLVQVVVGMVALLLNGVALPPFGQLVTTLGVLCVSGYLLHYVTNQLAARFGLLVGAVLTVLAALVLVVLMPSAWLAILLVVLSTMAVLMLTIFTGWQMKISHLRKALNFRGEAMYNLWRIAVRLVVPIALIAALVGWVGLWLS